MDGYTTFRRARHPMLAPNNAWTWKFLPGVLLGFAIKWWMDNGAKGDSGSQRVRKQTEQKTDRVLASKPAVTTNEEYKMVLLVNESLKMGKVRNHLADLWRLMSCAALSAVGVVEQHKQHAAEIFQAWQLKGHAKVALRVPTESEMLSIAEAARTQGIFTYVVVDAGRTQIAPGSRTVLAVGPAPKSSVDKLTGHLKLL